MCVLAIMEANRYEKSSIREGQARGLLDRQRLAGRAQHKTGAWCRLVLAIENTGAWCRTPDALIRIHDERLVSS